MSAPGEVSNPLSREADYRLRISQGAQLCLGEHVIHQDDSHLKIWLTCDGEEMVPPLILDDTRTDKSDEIRQYVTTMQARHERSLVDGLLIAAWDRRSRAEALVSTLGSALSEAVETFDDWVLAGERLSVVRDSDRVKVARAALASYQEWERADPNGEETP